MAQCCMGALASLVVGEEAELPPLACGILLSQPRDQSPSCTGRQISQSFDHQRSPLEKLLRLLFNYMLNARGT